MRYTLTHKPTRPPKTHIQNPIATTKTLCGDHIETIIYGTPEHPICKRCAHYYQQHWPNPSRHSEKPLAAYDLIESTSPGPYLEMFARQNRLGWDTWGDEALGHVEVGGSA